MARRKPMPGDRVDNRDRPCARPDQLEQTIMGALDDAVDFLCPRLDQIEATLLREFHMMTAPDYGPSQRQVV
jgi:hypothetical protein